MRVFIGKVVSMLGSIVSNHYVERIELLPDDIEIYVNRTWCSYVVTYLQIMEYSGDLLNMVSSLLVPRNIDGRPNISIPRFILMPVGDIKKLISICGCETLCCNFPYNYDEIASKFLEDKLGIIKTKIELLMEEDKIEDTFKIIDEIEDEYLKKLSLIYMKSIHGKKTEEIIEDVKNSRRKTINIINGRLY